MKRVVTGHDAEGRSVFLEVGEADHVVNAPGIVWREIWATHPDTTVPLKTDYKARMQSRWTSVFPQLGETRVRIVEFDPEQMEDGFSENTVARFKDELPGLMEHMEPEQSGMPGTIPVSAQLLGF